MKHGNRTFITRRNMVTGLALIAAPAVILAGADSPNAQAAVLIRMVELYPDTVERLSAI